MAYRILIIFFSMILLTGCSVTRWEVVNREKVDTSDYELLDSKPLLLQVGTVQPDRPVFQVSLFSENTYEYQKKIEVERSLQRYKPRLGYVLFGMLGATASFYAANTTEFDNNLSTTQSIALNTTGAILVGLSFLNSKPVGEPKVTGETRLMRKSGSEIRVDTVKVNGDPAEEVTVTVYFDDEVIVPRTARNFENGQLEMNLASEIRPASYSLNNTDLFRIQLVRKGKINNYSVPVTSVFKTFVEVTAEVTPLRSADMIDRENVLIDLAQGSQLELIEISQIWTKVKYGTYESFIATEDINVIWRPSEFAQRISVIEVPFVPFGNIDVETDIPTLYPATPERSALIVANENYRKAGTERTYVRRDGQLMESYFKEALGVRENRLSSVYDFESNLQVTRLYNTFATRLYSDSSEAYIYIAGNGFVDESGTTWLRTIDENDDDDAVNITALFEALANLDLKSLVIFVDMEMDTGFNGSFNWKDLADVVISQKPNSALIFGSSYGETSFPYMSAYGEQNRHFIFPYYLADALKTGNTEISAIVDHLNRNVSYTARRLYNRPQEVQVFGNLQINLAE